MRPINASQCIGEIPVLGRLTVMFSAEKVSPAWIDRAATIDLRTMGKLANSLAVGSLMPSPRPARSSGFPPPWRQIDQAPSCLMIRSFHAAIQGEVFFNHSGTHGHRRNGNGDTSSMVGVAHGHAE